MPPLAIDPQHFERVEIVALAREHCADSQVSNAGSMAAGVAGGALGGLMGSLFGSGGQAAVADARLSVRANYQ
jgi:predicted lipid-binding transport protein (Tim44 family)